MNSQTIVMCVVSLILGMLLANMLKSVCGCKVVEGIAPPGNTDAQGTCNAIEYYDPGYVSDLPKTAIRLALCSQNFTQNDCDSYQPGDIPICKWQPNN